MGPQESAALSFVLLFLVGRLFLLSATLNRPFDVCPEISRRLAFLMKINVQFPGLESVEHRHRQKEISGTPVA